MFKLFKTKREEVKENSSDVEIEVDGEKVSLNALVESYKKNKMVPVDVEHVMEVEDDKLNAEVEELLSSIEIEIEGEDKGEGESEVSPEEKMGSADMPADKQVSEVMPDEKKENEEEEEKPKEEEEKHNSFTQGLAASSERFNALKEASLKAVLDNGANGFQTIHERAELGRSRYGSKK